MAIIITGKSACALCGQTLLAEQEIVGTPHFIADRKDPLWRFSDAAMHRTCLDAWEHRAEFVAKYEHFLEDFRRFKKLSKTGTLAEYEQLLRKTQATVAQPLWHTISPGWRKPALRQTKNSKTK